jgi:serine O-acetyltransferase
MKRDVHTTLAYARHWPLVGKLAYYLLKLLGVEIPRSVRLGKDFLLVHGGFGVVIHPNTLIGDRVKIYPGVTLGRADIHHSIEDSAFEGFVVEDDVILAAGAKVLCEQGTLVLGARSMVGANAVLLQSAAPGEIWVGIPAKKVGMREDFSG